MIFFKKNTLEKKFTFGSYKLDTNRSIIEFNYSVDFPKNKRVTYKDMLWIPAATPEMWEKVNPALLQKLLENLTLILGINYWKIHCAPKIVIEQFDLSHDQAIFWNNLYTNGLAEFFFRSQIDFRNLVSFPYSETGATKNSPIKISDSNKILLTNGGGKDSIVSAEILKEHGIPFDLYTLGSTRVQEKAGVIIGKKTIKVMRKRDPSTIRLGILGIVKSGYPSVSTIIFTAALAAALNKARYIVLSNEQSADIGNTTYLGLDVNHQWSKSFGSEMLIRDYFSKFITPDIIPFSLLRQYTEIETLRRFVKHEQYYYDFSSCNENFKQKLPAVRNCPPNRSYWCNNCPKCVFIFACMTAFLPKQTVIGIFGTNLYSNYRLLPTFLELLGLEGFKPFECVGTPEEMIVAMHRAWQTGFYTEDPAMDLFIKKILPNVSSFEKLEKTVFSPKPNTGVPHDFTTLLNNVRQPI